MHFPMPTVAVINGHAFAAGVFIALAHDYRVMRKDRGWISTNEVKLKIRINKSSLSFIRSRLQGRALTDSMIFGKRLTGPEAQQLGIVDVVADVDNLISVAKKLASSALGPGGIDRDMLKVMKSDIYPRSSQRDTVSKLNTDCRGLITTGTGKYYSNGADLKWAATNTSEQTEEFWNEMQNLFWRLVHFPIPTVAAINGHTFGAGAFIAISHDYRIMRCDRGWISWNEIRHNIRISGPSLQILRLKLRHIGAIRDGTIFPRPITASEAIELGIVDFSVKIDCLIAESKRLLHSVMKTGNIDRNMLSIMKKDIYPRDSTVPPKLLSRI